MEQLPRYEIVRELGRGGMGAVLLGVHKSLGRQVAIKVLLGGSRVLDHELARFCREARTYKELLHPNLVKVYDAQLDGVLPHIVLEYIPGGDLFAELGPGVRRRIDAMSLARAMAGALAYIHERNILHRDIKPSNILIDADARPVLTDFGLVKLEGADLTALTADGSALGTLPYMAPEVLRGEPVGAPADVYSMGLTLFEAAFGRRVFTGLDPQGPGIPATRRMTGQIPTLTQLGARVEPELEAAIVACLAMAPESRPTGAQLAMLLDPDPAGERELPGGPEGSGRPGVPRRSTRRSRPVRVAVAPVTPPPAGRRWPM
ncbi:MAG: serine/threonine protein kinase, partial [Candidatus Riflebacteria bacterium]|nr:serine/threonine protein kinase [Candidatus Riflebacteria bacterium]